MTSDDATNHSHLVPPARRSQRQPRCASRREAIRRDRGITGRLAGLLLFLWMATGCAPTPQGNVLGYLVSRQLGTFPSAATTPGITGAITGTVVADGRPVEGARVVVAERTGHPHSAETNAAGEFRIEDIPIGRYVPAAVARGFQEGASHGRWGIPQLIAVEEERTSVAPPLVLTVQPPQPFPPDLADVAQLTATGWHTATAPFPAGSAAQVYSFSFVRDGVTNDTLRVYLPLVGAAQSSPAAGWPLVFILYPGVVDGWEAVSVAYAAQGYAVVALSPVGTWGTDVDAHAADARLALELVRQGALGQTAEIPVDAAHPVALGGSFSSAILHRLLRMEHAGGRDGNGPAPGAIRGWVTVGGIANAFTGAEAFYQGEIQIPEQYELLIPALGNPKVYPVPFLRYSPVYTADEMPPTLIIHTASDRIIPLEQAEELEAALRQADVPVETFYYEDTSHYLQINDQMTADAREMFFRVLDFIERYGTEPAPAR